MTEEEYKLRYADQFLKKGDFSQEEADAYADVGLGVALENGELETPEDDADEELSNWD